MFTKLAVSDRHTGCPYCNYQGCIWLTEKYPKMGHWLWVYAWYTSKYSPKKLWKRLKMRLTALDYSKIDDIELDGIDHRDYPDFCDAYICSASYKGRDMSDSELDRLNQDSDFVYQCVLDKVY